MLSWPLRKKELSVRKAAVVVGVPKDSLNHRVKGKLKNLSTDERRLVRYHAILSHGQENELEVHIMDQAFYVLSINDIRTFVYDYCQRNDFNSDNKMAGRDFVELDFLSATLSCPFKDWNTATQSASHDKPSSFEAQSREASSVIEETAPILPVPLESRNSPPAPKNHLW